MRRNGYKTVVAYALIFVLLMMCCGCSTVAGTGAAADTGIKDAEDISASTDENKEPAITVVPVETDKTEPEKPDEAAAEDDTADATGTDQDASLSGRKDGERFDAVIMLEGMDEPVTYEHIVNEEIGFEMDYEYEILARHTEPGKERFVAVYDSTEDPSVGLEVTYVNEDADSVAESARKEFSADYEIEEDMITLDNVGECKSIWTNAGKGGTRADIYKGVTIIPASNGCIVVTDHMTEGAQEGYGTRFSYMLDTLRVIDAKAR